MASELSGASSSSNIPSTSNNNRLPQPSTAAGTAPLLTSKDSNKAIDLKSSKNDLLYRIVVNVNYKLEHCYHYRTSYINQQDQLT